jgi:hypothetical protein
MSMASPMAAMPAQDILVTSDDNRLQQTPPANAVGQIDDVFNDAALTRFSYSRHKSSLPGQPFQRRLRLAREATLGGSLRQSFQGAP